MSKFELLLKSAFTASHRLRLPTGGDEPLHEHDWRIEVCLEGDELDETGLLADFSVLQPKLREITEELRGTALNNLPAFSACNPSAELIAKRICDRFAPTLPDQVRVVKVRVWETDQCGAAYVPSPIRTKPLIAPDPE
jgi:6-pyruvoyltetrahydropterin/6-carboxytetrahydropterin synthase